jgi:geranylgeranyl pyrophosphate synthase
MVDFTSNLAEKLDFIKDVLDTINMERVHPILKVPVEYAISTGGKRLRPLICTLCAEALGGDYRHTKHAFLALELLHNGTLVHDDIIDDDLYRRGTPSTQIKFGEKRAVLTGDALLSLGLVNAAATGKPEIVNWLSETSLKMVQGVALQTFYRRKLVSLEEYLQINYLKSGSLFEAAAALGGLMVSDDTEKVDKLILFGKAFGNAYQIRDDVYGIYSEEKSNDYVRSDITNGDISLPLIYALESEFITDADKEILKGLYQGHIKDPQPEKVQRIFEESGAIEKSIATMKQFAEEGRSYLMSIQSNTAIETLSHLLNEYYACFSPDIDNRLSYQRAHVI